MWFRNEFSSLAEVSLYSYLKYIVYDKLLNPRQSFRITLYLTVTEGPFWTSKLLNQVSCFRVWSSDFLSVCQLSARCRNGTYVPFVSAVGPHAVCITDRIIMHLPNCIKLCERAHLGHAWRVPSASTYVANKTLSISARVRTHNILRVRTTIRPYPWEIVASFFIHISLQITEAKPTVSVRCLVTPCVTDRYLPSLICAGAVLGICCDTDKRQRILLKWNFNEKMLWYGELLSRNHQT